MSNTESPLAATMQMREQFICSLVGTAARLREVTEKKYNPNIAYIVGGGLALVHQKPTKVEGSIFPTIYKFGSVRNPAIVEATPTTVNMWNKKHPNHVVMLMPLVEALRNEIVSQSLMLDTLEQRRIHFETNGEG